MSQSCGSHGWKQEDRGDRPYGCPYSGGRCFSAFWQITVICPEKLLRSSFAQALSCWISSGGSVIEIGINCLAITGTYDAVTVAQHKLSQARHSVLDRKYGKSGFSGTAHDLAGFLPYFGSVESSHVKSGHVVSGPVQSSPAESSETISRHWLIVQGKRSDPLLMSK